MKANVIERLRAWLRPAPEELPDELVTVATFTPVLRPHAHFLQTVLEAENIACILNGQYQTNADFVRLQVRRADAPRAQELLRIAEESHGE